MNNVFLDPSNHEKVGYYWNIWTKKAEIELNVKNILKERVRRLNSGRDNFIELCGEIEKVKKEC